MRKLGDLMKDIGFNKDSSEDVQKAFVKNLIRQAYGVELKEKPQNRSADERLREAQRKVGEQLTFELGDSPSKPSRKRGSGSIPA